MVSKLRGSPLRNVIVTGVPSPPAHVMLCDISTVFLVVRGLLTCMKI